MQGKVTMMMGAEVGDWEDRVPKQEGLQSASVGTLKASLTLCHPALGSSRDAGCGCWASCTCLLKECEGIMTFPLLADGP